MGFPKVLVASPTCRIMSYCEKEFLESIKNFDYPNYDILIVDNSKENDYFNHLKEDKEIIPIRVTEGENNLQRLINSRNQIFEYALKNNYEYLFMLDCDVICPKDSLKKLVNADKDIISGLYFGLFNVNGNLQKESIAYQILTEEEFSELKEKYTLPEYIKSRFDMKGHLTKGEINDKKVIQVAFPANGCCLFKRKVFEKLKYFLLDTSKYGNIQTDDALGFFIECNKSGFVSFCDTSIVCEHLIEGKFRIDKEGIRHHPIYD